jgi:hypothetical protein
MPTLRDEIIAA